MLMKEGELRWICAICGCASDSREAKPTKNCSNCYNRDNEFTNDWMLVRVVIHDEPEEPLPANVVPFRKKA